MLKIGFLGGIGSLRWTCAHSYLKWKTNKVLLFSTGNPAQCDVAAWMGGQFGGEWIHVCVGLSAFTVHRNYHYIVNWLYLSTR